MSNKDGNYMCVGACMGGQFPLRFGVRDIHEGIYCDLLSTFMKAFHLTSRTIL